MQMTLSFESLKIRVIMALFKGKGAKANKMTTIVV